MTALFLVAGAGERMRYIKDLDLFLLVIMTVMITAAGYIINDYYDVKIDYINRPKRVVVGKMLRRRVVMLSHMALNFAGISLGFYLDIKVGILATLCAVWLWLYSNALKRQPFIGNFSIALLTGAALCVIALYYNKNASLVYMYALFAFSISLIREIIKDLEDLKGDADFGSRTIPILLGVKRTKIFIFILSLVSLISISLISYFLQNPIFKIYFLLLMLPVTYFLYRLLQADTRKEFSYLNNFCKLIMLSGVLSMVFF